MINCLCTYMLRMKTCLDNHNSFCKPFYFVMDKGWGLCWRRFTYSMKGDRIISGVEEAVSKSRLCIIHHTSSWVQVVPLLGNVMISTSSSRNLLCCRETCMGTYAKRTFPSNLYNDVGIVRMSYDRKTDFPKRFQVHFETVNDFDIKETWISYMVSDCFEVLYGEVGNANLQTIHTPL